MWAASAGTIALCSAKIRSELDDHRIPLMGVLGAFLFAAQMINFSIPATGSSGHLGGGLLLAILLGPHAAFIAISSVLVVQALFFADGGLLALGCNIFNIGFIPAFIVYPLIYKPLAGSNPSRARISTATMVSAIICLQLGPFGVVLETLFSGISALPFSAFALLMQPIHLAIGIVEGCVTLAIVTFVYQARPEIIRATHASQPVGGLQMRKLLVSFLLAALLAGAFLSWHASKKPDGLEWAIAAVTGKEELPGPVRGVHAAFASIQDKIAFLPDYSFRNPSDAASGTLKAEKERQREESARLGTSIAGIVGGLLTLLLTFLSGFLLRKKAQAAS